MGKPLKKLSNYPGIWRIDGYSNMQLYANSAPRVFISLSQIKEEGSDVALYNGQVTGKQIWLNEPLSRISDLLIGSCWRGGKDGEGKRINRPAPMSKSFLVDTSKVQIVKLIEPVTLNGVEYRSALPSRAIKLGKHLNRMKDSFYAVVPVLNDADTKFLVISCYELYRAYLGVSSGLMNNIVQGDLRKFFEWNDPKLRAKRRLSRLEQFVAYRGHYDQEGREWFYMPSNHLKATRMANQYEEEQNREPLVLKATFPFKGRTLLTVAGKAFRNVNDKGSVWCVFAANLLHCSSPVDFDVQIESDKYSTSPLPWSNETGGSAHDEEDEFDEEDLPDSEEPPNARGRGAHLLNSNNFFGAMRDVGFQHYDTGESKDPVYEKDTGEPLDAYSLEELESKSEGEPKILQTGEFDSHIDTVGRELSDFIKMIVRLRGLVAKRGWELRTRNRGSALIIVEGEVVTTFLQSNNPRKSWHLIEDENQDRLRQIVWVEIALGNDQFIYIMEMELKESESGKSTLCVIANGYKYMGEEDFRIFLGMTAVQNKWPRASHQWKSDKAYAAAKNYFSAYSHLGISHPATHHTKDGKREPLDNSELKDKWASNIEQVLLEISGGQQ
ncbi:hypothetical protein [Idiomarina sp.]|uniref:hypothetical protein n=1 Tax=Idiomarina sp. TaxID=1874361 RepID=UPI003A8D9FFA